MTETITHTQECQKKKYFKITSKMKIDKMKSQGKSFYIQYGPEGCHKITEPIESFVKNMLNSPEILHEQGLFEDTWTFKIIPMTEAEYKTLPEFIGF